MRVHDSNLNSVSIGTHQTGRTEATQSGRGASNTHNSSATDRISLSDLGSLVRSVSGDTPDRTDKVNRIAAAYKSGNYHVQASAVSKGIVNDSLSAG